MGHTCHDAYITWTQSTGRKRFWLDIRGGDVNAAGFHNNCIACKQRSHTRFLVEKNFMSRTAWLRCILESYSGQPESI